MKKLLIGLAMLVGAEGAAQACSCMPLTGDPAQMRQLANELAQGAVALVDVDVRSGYNPRTRRGELMRVRQTVAGRAPRDFRIARQGAPSSAACDVEYQAGSNALVLLYRADRPMVRGQRQFRDGGLCVSMFLHNAQFRQMLIEAMRRPRAASEANGSPAGAPCANNA